MDVKDRRHRSLTRGRCGKECRYTSSSLDSEDCRVPTQKSYSSSETLKAYDHDTRMHYGNRVTDLVHRESDEFPRQDQQITVKTLITHENIVSYMARELISSVRTFSIIHWILLSCFCLGIGVWFSVMIKTIWRKRKQVIKNLAVPKLWVRILPYRVKI